MRQYAFFSPSTRRRHAIFIGAGLAIISAALAILLFLSTAESTTAAGGIAPALVYALIFSVASCAAISWRHSQPQRPRQALRDGAWDVLPDMLDDLIVGLDTSGSVLGFPPNSATRCGLPTHRLLGHGLVEHVHVADRPAFLKLIANATHGDRTYPLKLRLRTWGQRIDTPEPSHPKYIWVEMRVRRRADRGTSDVIAIFRDIDAAYAHEAAMAAARKAIEEAVGTKDHFLADMSHELRTPLNAVIGFSEMLASRTLRPADSDKQMDYARIIHQSGQHLLSIVNAVLDVSKIQSGTLSMVPKRFEIEPLMDLCCDMVTLKAEEGGVQLIKDCPVDLEGIVGDKRACQQILINLLSNAVKFTPKLGQVTISARSDGTALHLSVSDTGIGIGAADLARLGDPFFQARSAVRRKFEGTGLGLSVVRGLVGLQGGTIAIESEVGRGTRVDVRLPLDWKAAAPEPRPVAIDGIERHGDFGPALGRTDRRMKQFA